MMTFVHYNFYDLEEEFGIEGVHLFFDILQIIVYFLESMPSIIMFVVRWRILRNYSLIHQQHYDKMGESSHDLSDSSNVGSNIYRMSYIKRNMDRLTLSSKKAERVNDSKEKFSSNHSTGYQVLYDDRYGERSDE